MKWLASGGQVDEFCTKITDLSAANVTRQNDNPNSDAILDIPEPEKGVDDYEEKMAFYNGAVALVKEAATLYGVGLTEM